MDVATQCYGGLFRDAAQQGWQGHLATGSAYYMTSPYLGRWPCEWYCTNYCTWLYMVVCDSAEAGRFQE